MPNETSYALKQTSFRIKNDGTKVFVTLEMHGAPPTRFHVNVDGLGSLIVMFQDVSRRMIEKLVAAGKQRGTSDTAPLECEPMRVISAQVGRLSDGSAVTLVAQTEDGPMVTLALPADISQSLGKGILEASESLSSESKSSSRH